ncbi:hypothetical protein Q4I30_002827 [Leishmania utingensis]|uniref:Flagellum transition zone component n=1 Tax=Leishmania utingensis TaxID=653362 RepID=A0AAW3APX0_9TRYP
MQAPMAQPEDYRLMEPSPSPPATLRVPIPDFQMRDSGASHNTCLDDLLWSSSSLQSSPPSSQSSNSTQHTQSQGETFAHLAASEADRPSLARSMASQSQGSSQRRPSGAVHEERSSSIYAVASAAGPLSTRLVNAVPTPAHSKRHPGSLAAVPAPLFTWEEGDNARRVSGGSDGKAEEEERQRLTEPAAPRWPPSLCQQRNRVSGSSGSGSGTSQQRRSSVLGPDPRDCIDLHGDDVVEKEAHASPLTYDLHQQSAPALAYDLAALVNADTIERCRSNSRGQVDLIDNDAADEVEKKAVGTPTRVEPARHIEHSSDDVDASYEFEQEYFYYPATSPEMIGLDETGDRATSVLRREKTPRRAGSGSSSGSSVPRWVLSLAEETPFTPFVLSTTGVATAQSPFLHVSPARRATATEEQLTQGHVRTSDGAQQHQRIPTQRLKANELVAAVLSSSACTEAALNKATPVLTSTHTPTANAADKVEDASEGQPEEPLPRRPRGCDEGTLAEREQLRQRVRDTRARLAHVDQLMARFDVVVAARQAELENLREKHAVLTQQVESYKSRADAATREVRRLRERQHREDEVRLLCNMMEDKENRLRVAQSQLLSLQTLWKRLQLLRTAAAERTESSAEERAHHVPSARADSVTDGGSAPCLSMQATHRAAAGITVQATDSAEDSQEEEQAPPSPASSVASLNTCDALSDFFEELLSEVEELAKVCIQLPSATPAAAVFSDPADKGPQRAQPSRPHPTYTTLNRRLNDGNNGFFSFFGGATEAHLDSKPLSTFLANLDRLARMSWEREEELQLRARELATEEEENHLKDRLVLEYSAKLQQPQPPQHLSSINSRDNAGEKMNPLPTSSPVALFSTREEEHLGNGGAKGTPITTSPASLLIPPNNATAASTDLAMLQLSLSSPEHGRRSRVGPRTPNSTALSSSASSSRLHHHVTPAPLLLPTLVYAYPRVAAVSQHLDAEQQQIQVDYAAAIEAERQGRRQLTMQLRDTYRHHVAPVLRRTIDALRRQQTSLARQLAELGVKTVIIQWEEEEEVNDAALLRAIDEATAAAQKPLRRIQRRGAASSRSRSRVSAKRSAHEGEECSYGDASSSQCTSLARSENGGLRSEAAAALPPPCRAYRRTLRITCAAACERNSIEGEDAATIPVSSPPPSGRHPFQPTTRPLPSSARPSIGPGCLNARSARKRPSSASSPSEAPVEQSTTTSSARLCAASPSKVYAALQLCTNSPTKALLQNRRDAHNATGERESYATVAVASPRRAPVRTVVTPIATASFRRSGGTPRASGATGASTTTRTSTAVASGRSSRACGSAVMPSSPRQSCGCATASSPWATSQQHRRSGLGSRALSARMGRPAESCCSFQNPVVEDVRELVETLDSEFAVSTRVTTTTPMPVNVWKSFEHTRQALTDGAVRVALTFTGEEARRRQEAQAKKEAHRREFWELREELARIDEDIFQLRTRWTELQSTRESTEAEQRIKLAEAEAKVKKCRAFYQSLRRENEEWRNIHAELEQAIRGKTED